MLYWIKLKRIRIKEQKKLDEVNLKMFKKIIEYIKNSNLQYLEKEEALHQIMDILLQSQNEYRSADVIIGDYEVLCKSIIEEYTNDKNAVYKVLHHIQRAIMFILSSLVIAVIFDKVFYTKIDAGISVNLLIFAFGIAFILKPFANNRKKRKWASIIFFVVTMFAISYITETQHGAIIDKAIIINTNAILLGMTLIIIVIEIYKRTSDRKNIRSN